MEPLAFVFTSWRRPLGAILVAMGTGLHLLAFSVALPLWLWGEWTPETRLSESERHPSCGTNHHVAECDERLAHWVLHPIDEDRFNELNARSHLDSWFDGPAPDEAIDWHLADLDPHHEQAEFWLGRMEQVHNDWNPGTWPQTQVEKVEDALVLETGAFFTAWRKASHVAMLPLNFELQQLAELDERDRFRAQLTYPATLTCLTLVGLALPFGLLGGIVWRRHRPVRVTLTRHRVEIDGTGYLLEALTPTELDEILHRCRRVADRAETQQLRAAIAERQRALEGAEDRSTERRRLEQGLSAIE